jgi:hypothetical protein
MALLQHNYVALDRALDMVVQMPLGHDEQRRLRATIRRWAKALHETDQTPTDCA